MPMLLLIAIKVIGPTRIEYRPIAYCNKGHRCPLEFNIGLSFIAIKRIGACLIYKRVRMSLDAPASFLAQQRAFVEEHHGLDDPDSRRNLHRSRDQRLSAGRV